jgi:hypothetical protein
MPALLDLQRAMRERLLAMQPDVDARQEEVLAVYRHTIGSTLTNALRLSYPAVLRLVGAEFFEGAAHEFIHLHAPRSACLNDYGESLADFLAQFAPAATLPYLTEVARLEWAVNRALHAPDVAAIDLTRLATLGEAALPWVSFTAHPGLTLQRMQFPADAIWSAVLDQDSEAMARIDLKSGPVQLLVERDANGVQVRRLSPWAWNFTQSLMLGRPLHAALDDGPAPDGEVLNALLADHLASGRFIDYSWTGEPAP